MAELVAVLDTKERLAIDSDLGRVVRTTDSTVMGLRVNDSPTIAHANYEPKGKPFERSWQMPDELAFATHAFFEVVYARRQLPSDRIYDCHAFAAYALGLSPNMTRTPQERPLPYDLKADAVPSFIMLPWKGYYLNRTMGRAAGVHSLVALPKRFGLIPECMGVTGVGGDLVVAKTNTLPYVYAGQKFHRILGAAEATPNGQ